MFHLGQKFAVIQLMSQMKGKPMRYPNPESNIIELKEAIPKNNQIIKTAIAFCIEKLGSGFRTLFESYEVAGLI